MAFVRHLQVTLESATFKDPLSSSLDERMVYVKASHKNIVYTTNMVEGVGNVELHHLWDNDGTNVFHFAYEDNSEDIILELFNRDHICIGISRLHLAGLAKVMPEQDPELKTLPVSSLGRRWSYGSLALTAQIKRQQTMGKLGNLNVVLQEGIIDSISSRLGFISPAATEPRVFAMLSYKHTTHTVGTLRGESNKFVWHEHFTFRINSWDPGDVLEICIYYGAFQVGECKVLLSLFINLEEDLQADRKDFFIRTEDLLVEKRSVGFIKVAGSFSTLHKLDVLRALIKLKRPEFHPPRFPPPELPGFTKLASITNEIRGEGKIEVDIVQTDISKSEVQLESKEIRNAGKPTSIGDYLTIDLTGDLLGASSGGYVIRTICPDGQGGRYSCALKRIDTMDESEPDLARLCHPHVVHLFHHWKKKIDYGEVREWMPKSAFMTFLMMELMDGDLGNLMTSIKTTGLTPLSLLVAVHVMLQIAKGMLYLHEMGVSHPHLKCNNVLCRVKSTAQIPFQVGDVLVKLGGFGCSRVANDDTKKRDVFCFGLTCLEILTGDECFEDIYGADKVSRPSIPETTPCILKDCIASCLDTKITFSEAITLLLLAQSQIIQTCEDKRILCSVNLHIKSTLSNNQDIASSSTSKSDRHEMFHVHQLHPQLDKVATFVQITLIFFHGFPKDSEEWRMTWLTRDNKLVWPQMWLPEDLGAGIRVLSVSFDDNPNVRSTQSIMDLLKILVMSATCKLGETDQAIVLVGHSFGGVIIKDLVAAAQGLAGKTVYNDVKFQEVLKCKNFLKRLASIVFYSVPHAFANMEFENYISGCSNTRVLQRSFLLKALRRDSIFISDMIQSSKDFENAVPRKTKLLGFLEGKPMSKKSLLVTENSWEGLSVSWEWHKIDRDNHFEVCRPVSKSHIGYKVLLNHLQQHMCSPSAVNVRRVWKVIGTVLICICKFKEVLSRYRMVKCFSAEDTAAGRLGKRHNPMGIFTSPGYLNYDSLDDPSQLSTSANLYSLPGSSGIPDLAAMTGTGLHNDIRSFDNRQFFDFFAANMQDHVKKEEGSDDHARIGLNLGVRTNFLTEDTTAGGLGMRHRAGSPSSQVPMCQVEGCKADLSTGKDYYRRHKVDEFHSKAPTIIVGGPPQRFCQQCSRFHILNEFDGGKRSCKRRLAGHNKRLRKPQPSVSTTLKPSTESIGINPGEDGDLHAGVNPTNDPKSMLKMQHLMSTDSESGITSASANSPNSQGERWMQRSTMNGFLELESLESLNGRLSETDTWYEIFQQLAGQAARLDAVGNGTEAEMFYHQCKLYLEEASEGDKDVAESSNLPIALCWVYLALANLHRYSLMPDYWKATEYLLLLLSTRAKVVSSSEGMGAPSYNEIRFALCLTVFEWVDVLEEFDQAAGMALLNAVPLEEARGIVDEWETLDDVEVASSLAYMLSLGYAKLQRNDRESYWNQWLTDLKLQFVITGDPLLDKLPKYLSVEFQQFSKKMKFYLQRFREFGAKAAAAKAAGQILAAEQCYRQCEAAVRAAGDEFPILARLKTLGWAYENLARIYRLDLVDRSKAIECYRASLSEAIQVHTGLDSTIRALKLFIIEVMYETAYDADILLDVERQARLVAEATLEIRKLFPEVLDGSMSDLDVGNFICFLLSTRYESWGRVAEARFWNDERLKLMDKTKSSYNGIRLRSAGLLTNLGEHKNADEIVTSVLKCLKKSSTQESAAAMRSLAALPYTSRLKRETYQRRIIENPEIGLPAMTTDVIEQEYKAEVEWAEQFLERFKLNDDTNHEKPDQITRWNLQCFKGEQLMSEGKLEEAVACFHKGLELISEGGGDDMYMMGCHGQIGACYYMLFLRAVRFEVQCGVGAYPGNHDTNMAFMHHFHLSKDNLQSALKVAEQREDIYNMASYNRLLGSLLYTNWRLVLPGHDKHSKDGYNCLRTALNHFKASGRNLNRFLYGLRDTNKLWISVLERQDGMSMSAYYLIQRSIYEIIRGEYFRNQMIISREYIQFSSLWGLQALLWAERGHSRSLAFKLTERNMGPSTRSELQRFDMDDWGEASASIIESRDVSGPGTVMLEFVKAEEEDKERFIIYSVTPDGAVRMQLSDKPEKDLKILLKNLHDHMSQEPESNLSDQELMQILEDLYEAFFSPMQLVLDDMEEHHKLVICANKILAGVPFAALRNPKTKKFLIERHTVVCTPSLRILKQCDERLKTLQSLPLMEGTGAALVLGDPAFSSDRDRLIDSGKEANTVADILGRSNVLLLKGKSALKKDVLEWAQRATGSGKYQALMHLATHGKGADDDFKEGALQFADPKVKAWPPVPTPRDSHDRSNLRESQIKTSDETSSSTSSTSLKAQEEEFVYCGRGHTGPRRGELDPCHLTSEEIVKDHEWRMLLVVLSACETARGEVKSEGTFNLARALLISGVPSTVVSQWKVDDASAPTLMEGMYKAMKKDDLDVASALRASMLDMIKNGYWIHQWAPFVVMGLGTVKLPKTFLETKKNLISSV